MHSNPERAFSTDRFLHKDLACCYQVHVTDARRSYTAILMVIPLLDDMINANLAKLRDEFERIN
jgi:hypothetical protein